MYDEEPEIISYGKSAATDIGDFMHSFEEHMYLISGKMSDEIREYSIECTSPLLPDLANQPTSDSLYGRDIIPTDFPSDEKQKVNYKNFKNNVSLGQKFTDDTFFDKNAYATCLEHDEEYELSKDENQYDFVSKNENFANTETTKNNLEHSYTSKLATSYQNSRYTRDEFGDGAKGVLNMISKHASDRKSEKFNFSEVIFDYKKQEANRGGFGGRSYGNGAVMQNGANIFAAQGFKQGLKLTDTLINNIYDHDYSRKAARALFTAGFCANIGLRQETILNIIHFLYYDPDPLKNGENYTNPEKGPKLPGTEKLFPFDAQFLKVGEYNFCNFDMISHRGGKTRDNTKQDELQKIDENDCNGYAKHNYFATNALATAMLVIKICLTSKCAEEAVIKILLAAGDSDTIAAAAIPIIAALFGLPKDWVEKIWVYSMQTKKMTKEKPTPENTKHADEPDDLKNIKKFDEKGNFIYHNEINRLADKTYGHHYRENAKIEWQLKNIYELMEYLVKEKENSKAENKDELLNYIFKRIRADIDFMLDRNKEYELEKEPELDITEKEIERAKKLTEEEALSSKESHALRLKYLRAKNKVRIYKHRNATARFQTKAKNDKLNNLTRENIANIKTELEKVNNFFDTHNINEKIQADKYEALIENNCKADNMKKNGFYDDKIYDDMYKKALETLEIKKKKDAEYITAEKLKALKQGPDTNTKIIFWTWKKKSSAGAVALVIIAVNVVMFWQLSFAVAFWSALGTWVLYFFVLWLINHFNESKPIDAIGTKGQNNDKNPVTVKGKTKEITQPLIYDKDGPIIDPNQKNNSN
ncbi:MAG: hypothetical protein IJU86_04000 [Firmicutes bacterium]|nr:hypothetical protein [Bacillota bacterium]